MEIQEVLAPQNPFSNKRVVDKTLNEATLLF